MKSLPIPIVLVILTAGLNWAPEKVLNVCHFALWAISVVLIFAYIDIGIKADNEDPAVIARAKYFSKSSDFVFSLAQLLNGTALLFIVMAGKYVLAVVFIVTVIAWLGARNSIYELSKKLREEDP